MTMLFGAGRLYDMRRSSIPERDLAAAINKMSLLNATDRHAGRYAVWADGSSGFFSRV